MKRKVDTKKNTEETRAPLISNGVKKTIITCLLFLLFAPNVFAQDRFSVTPAIIDEKVLPREIVSETITVTNLTESNVDVYAIVNNIDVSSGKQEFLNRADVELKDSLANWISVTRGVIRLSPGESRDVNVSINVNLNAEPGKYHAAISFMWGGSRAWAENNVKKGVATIVNIEVADNVKERLQLGTFTSRELFFATPDVSFSYDLENTGNRDLVPVGEVRIYDRKGREVGAVAANKDGATIAPNETGQIASAWTATAGFGKYKALLDIEYGDSQLGTVNDTIYFWVVPWKTIVGLFLTLASVVGLFTYMWWGRYERRRDPAFVRTLEKRRYARHTGSLLVDGTEPRPFVSNAPTNAHVMDMRD